MDESSIIEHAHEMDAEALIERYRQKGYELVERTPPTIVAQARFERFVFLPKELAALMPPLEPSEPAEEPTPMARVKKRFLSHFLKPNIAD